MLTSVTSQGVVISYGRLELKEFETWNYNAIVTFLHSCHLRVLVTHCYEIPVSCHFNQLVVKLGLNFFNQYLKVLRYVFDSASMKQNEVKYFGSFRHVLFPLGLFVNHRG